MQKLWLVAAFALGVAGCSPSVRYEGASAEDGVLRTFVLPNRPDAVLVVTADLDGVEDSASPAFVERISTAFRDSGLFSSVSTEKAPGDDSDAVVIRVHGHDRIDTNHAANVTKGVFIGLTAYALTPVLPITGSIENELEVEVSWPGKGTRTFTAKSAAHRSAHLFADHGSLVRESGTKVIGANIRSVVNEMVDWAKGDPPPSVRPSVEPPATADPPPAASSATANCTTDQILSMKASGLNDDQVRRACEN